jgi:N-acetylglucosaminyl-diphospho-decaprenol L-rhamnosyltransferase
LKPDCSIVVVTYNSAECIDRCLDACLRFELPVIVVDNASSDATLAEVAKRPQVLLLRNDTNEGFAAAINAGIQAAATPKVLLLNPDAEPVTGLIFLNAAVDGTVVGAAGGRLLGSDGIEQVGFQHRRLPTPWTLAFEVLGFNRLFPGNPVNRRYRLSAPAEFVEQPAGAFLLIHKSAWSAIGGFDETFYPAWFEDVDFCKRLLDAGYKIRYVPEAVAIHEGGHSFRKIEWRTRQVQWYVSLLRYGSKHFSWSGRALVCTALIVASVPRAIVGLWTQRSAEALVVFSRVLALSFRFLTGRGEAGVPRRSIKTAQTYALDPLSGACVSGVTAVRHKISQPDGFNG